MNFGEPQYLYVLALAPIMALLLFLAVIRKRTLVSRMGDSALLSQLSASINRRGRRLRIGLWFLALVLIVIALARPQWGSSTENIERQGIQVMVAMDISTSMLAEDMRPNRLTRAKLEAADLMNSLAGDEVGLVLFSGVSFVQFPRTFDYTTAEAFLEGANPELISRQGTVIEDAIDTSIAGLDLEREGQKAIVIMTDGENQEGDAVGAAQRAARRNVNIFTIGFGTAQGERIPEYDRNGSLLNFKTDAQGQEVITRLDEATLQQIAQEGGGKHFRASESGTVDALVNELNNLQQARFDSEIETRRIDRFQWFLGAVLLALVLIELIPDRVRKRTANQDQT